MSYLSCGRCRALFSTDEQFMRVHVSVVMGDVHETLDQVLLCAACTEAVGDDLSLETATFDKNH